MTIHEIVLELAKKKDKIDASVTQTLVTREASNALFDAIVILRRLQGYDPLLSYYE